MLLTTNILANNIVGNLKGLSGTNENCSINEILI